MVIVGVLQSIGGVLQPNQHWHPFTDTFSAFLAGDFEALHELEMREAHGEEYGNDLDF